MGCGASRRSSGTHDFSNIERTTSNAKLAFVFDNTDADASASDGSLESCPSPEMHPKNNPFGTFDAETKRKSHMVQSDDNHVEAFLFSDFTIHEEQIKQIQAKKGTRPNRGNMVPRVKGARKDDSGTFQFSDFAINVVSDLEEEIVSAHLTKKRADGEKLRKEEEEALFQFGDFKVTQADKAINQRSRDSRRRIRSYKVNHLLGHSTRVKTIGLLSTETSYVSCSNMDTDLGMYDVETGREIVSFVGHASTISGASLSQNTKLIATTSTDYNMILWDAVTGKQIFIFEHAKIVVCSCFSADTKFLISGSQDKMCRVWDTRKGRLLRTYAGHTGIIVSLSYSPCNDNIASASSDKTLKVWNATTGMDVHTLQGHTGIVLSCQYSFDGQRVVSNDESTIRVWNAVSGVIILKLSVDLITPAVQVTVPRRLTWTLTSYCTGRGQYIVAACSDRTVRLFQSTTGREVLSLYCKAVVYCLSCGTENKIVFGDSYGNIYVVTLT